MANAYTSENHTTRNAECPFDNGRVLAAGVEPPLLQALFSLNLEVCRHEIHQEPLPTCEFELVHARLGLLRLPEPESALRRMMAALKPGG
jgi:hypothetical protein